jgi:hypothetical protein
MLACHFLNDVNFLRNVAMTCISHHGSKQQAARLICYAMCQLAIGCDVDLHACLKVFVKRLEGRDHFGQIAFPTDF